MFKQDNQIWLYLIGILIMFGLLIAATNSIIFPFIRDPINATFNISAFSSKPEMDIDKNLNYLAKLNTNQGNITIDLFEKNAPINVNNFIHLANGKYYDNTKFHRLIKDLLLQGGDRNTLNSDSGDDGKGKPGYLIETEVNWDSLDLNQTTRDRLSSLGYSSASNLESKRFETYSLAMANAGADTNGSQFFIVLASGDDNRIRELDGQYTNIGKVIEGIDVLNKIKNIEVDNTNPQIPRPKQDVVLLSVEIFTR